MGLSLSKILREIKSSEKKALENTLSSTVSDSVQAVIDWVSKISDDDLKKKFLINDRVPLGNGMAGVVFSSVDPKQVVKVSPISSDYDMFGNDEVEGVPRIHKRKRIRMPDGKCLHLVVMDKFKPLSNGAHEILSKLRDIWQNRHDKDYQSYDLLRSKKRFKILKSAYEDMKHDLDDEQKKVFVSLLKTLKTLHKNNIAFNDFKPEQFMFNDDDSLQIVDLGSLRKL